MILLQMFPNYVHLEICSCIMFDIKDNVLMSQYDPAQWSLLCVCM